MPLKFFNWNISRKSSITLHIRFNKNPFSGAPVVTSLLEKGAILIRVQPGFERPYKYKFRPV
jgi:hypothetical protein